MLLRLSLAVSRDLEIYQTYEQERDFVPEISVSLKSVASHITMVETIQERNASLRAPLVETILAKQLLEHGNSFEMDDDYVVQTILSLPNMLAKAGDILKQTLAHNESQFLNTTHLADNEPALRMWAVRLIYLAIHYHQHHHAFKEAHHLIKSLDRGTISCATEREKLAIGKFDFECPAAKFLVVSNTNNGLGANMVGVVVPTLMAGLVSNRIVLFQNGPAGGRWPLASCPRGDYQCFFAPPSPCVPTEKELKDIYTLSIEEKAMLFNDGVVPEDRQNDRVLYLSSGHRHKTPKNPKFGDKLESTLRNISTALIAQLPAEESRQSILQQAANLILALDESRPGFPIQRSKIFHALSFYALRPNPSYSKKVDEIVKNSLPKNFDPNQAIGLPIRGKMPPIVLDSGTSVICTRAASGSPIPFLPCQRPTSVTVRASV
jgi:hypothetical protein